MFKTSTYRRTLDICNVCCGSRRKKQGSFVSNSILILAEGVHRIELEQYNLFSVDMSPVRAGYE